MSTESIVIVSATNLYTRNMDFSFVVDEEVMGKLNNRKKEFSLPIGRHTARLQYYLLKSNTVEFNVNEDRDTRLSWGLGLKSLFIPAILAITAGSLSLKMSEAEAMKILIPLFIGCMIVNLILLVKAPGFFVSLKEKT